MFIIKRFNRYLDKRDCYDCMYHMYYYYNNNISSRCMLYKYNSIIHSKELYDYSFAVRSDPKRCGLNGKYYINKKEVFNRKPENK